MNSDAPSLLMPNGIAVLELNGVSVLMFASPEMRKRVGEMLAGADAQVTRCAVYSTDEVSKERVAEALELSRKLYPTDANEKVFKQFTLTMQPKLPRKIVTYCPACAKLHVDEGIWATTRLHRTHQCAGCGHLWRPVDTEPTVGVAPGEEDKP